MKIEKILSENDVGQTGSHQAGILLPKTSGAANLFAELNKKNPRLALVFRDENGTAWTFTAIYYNNKFYGGTRDEFRLTGVTAFIRSKALSAGDVLILESEGTDQFQVRYRKTPFTVIPIPETITPVASIVPFSVLPDVRSKSVSAMTQLNVEAYLELAEKAYANQGGIRGQRQALTTTTAKRIRATMVEDLVKGTILPPLVVGVLVNEEQLEGLRNNPGKEIPRLLADASDRTFSIIDGMQRTTALLELDSQLRKERFVRVEFWFTASTRSMIYRMLVLNTGQVPWTLRRQIEVVFEPLLSELEDDQTDIKISNVERSDSSRSPGEFGGSNVVELFLVYGARKEKVDTKERLAEEFTKLDLLEATSRELFTASFRSALTYLAKLDIALAAADATYDSDSLRFRKGTDLFDSQPACVGFMTAISLQIFGRPGLTRSVADQNRAGDAVFRRLDDLLDRLESLPPEGKAEFLAFPMLNEIISGHKSGKVGDFEREFFTKAFLTMLEENDLVSSLEPCWRSY